MKKSINLVCLLLVTSLLSGCWDLRENERMFYVHGVGVDYKDGMYEVYLQIISFANVAKSEQVNQDVVQAEVNSAKGKTFTEAIFELYHSIDEEVYWGHLSFFIVTENVLRKDNLDSVFNTLTQHTDTRYQTWVYCTDDKLDELLQAVPLLKRAITLTSLSDPYNSFIQESFIEPMSMRKFIIQINEPSYDVKIPYVTLNKDWKTSKGPDTSVEMSGVGVVSPNDFKGLLKGDKAKGIQWLSKESVRNQITSKVEGTKDNYVTIVLQNVNVNIEPIVESSEVQFDIHLNATVSLNSYTDTVSMDDIRKTVEKIVSEEIMTTYKEGLKMKADIYRLSEKLYRTNTKLWKEVQTDGKIPLSEKTIRNILITIENFDSGRKEYKTTID
ncbi:Ger(X)C family germination protein OS=Ureibacillus acetophenoni OX=614649 GN=SAMN05877842_10961 PE=3 SV=1 [Ureibacillus acetophenoni]